MIFTMKVLRIFAYLLFIFTPSIAVLMFAAFVLKDTWYFQMLGLPALFINGLATFVKPVRTGIKNKLESIAKGR
jgi:hypothetical protein